MQCSHKNTCYFGEMDPLHTQIKLAQHIPTLINTAKESTSLKRRGGMEVKVRIMSCF